MIGNHFNAVFGSHINSNVKKYTFAKDDFRELHSLFVEQSKIIIDSSVVSGIKENLTSQTIDSQLCKLAVVVDSDEEDDTSVLIEGQLVDSQLCKLAVVVDSDEEDDTSVLIEVEDNNLPKDNPWQCTECEYFNCADNPICIACDKSWVCKCTMVRQRNNVKNSCQDCLIEVAPLSSRDGLDRGWKCRVCTLSNVRVNLCASCGKKKGTPPNTIPETGKLKRKIVNANDKPKKKSK
jgi:hypothetical protein